MSKKRTSARTLKGETPYDPRDRAATLNFWKGATVHRGLSDLRAKRGRPPKPVEERKEQITLRVDADVLAWYRAQGAGWQTRMNAVLKAHRDTSVKVRPARNSRSRNA